MKINLTICGVFELSTQVGKPWTHVISIWDKTHLEDVGSRAQVKAVAPGAKILFSYFADTSSPNDPEAPTLGDVQRILDFTSHLPPKAMLLIHCRAGVSRSTATAYAILCQHTLPGKEMDNLIHVDSLRDLVVPNRLIVQFADQILQRNGAMLLQLNRLE